MFTQMNWMIWVIIGLAVVLLLFIPRGGLLAVWRRQREAAKRQQVENALKYILTRQNEGHPPSSDGLAGALQLSERAVLKLVKQLQTQGLVERRGNLLLLTLEGQRWAVQIVRAHRLWERYLADEARMPLRGIHREAQKRGRSMSAAQIDKLDAALGYPSRDPHGDPIPSPSGTLRGRRSDLPAPLALTDWQPGQRGRITHLEDEPEFVFAELLAEGLRLGQVVTILENSPERITLTVGDRECVLSPAIAANVFLEPLEGAEFIPEGSIPLADLPNFVQAEIVDVDPSCQGFTRRRFLDLGLTPGALITPELDNTFHDPRAYRVRGTLIALRKDQAEMIRVRPQPEIGAQQALS